MRALLWLARLVCLAAALAWTFIALGHLAYTQLPHAGQAAWNAFTFVLLHVIAGRAREGRRR